MRTYLLIGVILFTVGVYFIWSQTATAPVPDKEVPGNGSQITGTLTTYTNQPLEFSFVYPDGPKGYVVEEDVPGFSDHPGFVHGVKLTQRDEYEAFHATTEAREGPPTIQVRVIENPERLSPAVWAMRNPTESGIERAFAEPEEAVIGGANAVHYVADGLYAMETYVVAHGGYIYLLVGMYLDPESTIAEDFATLVDSFAFIPQDAPTSADNAPPGSVHNLPVPEAVAAVRAQASASFGVPEGEVIVLQASEETWPDGCLGLARPNEACTEALVSGYRVTVKVGADEHTYRTDSKGTTIRREE